MQLCLAGGLCRVAGNHTKILNCMFAFCLTFNENTYILSYESTFNLIFCDMIQDNLF
jgi:hypothetical protein